MTVTVEVFFNELLSFRGLVASALCTIIARRQGAIKRKAVGSGANSQIQIMPFDLPIMSLTKVHHTL
jgi:hypothetical protein